MVDHIELDRLSVFESHDPSGIKVEFDTAYIDGDADSTVIRIPESDYAEKRPPLPRHPVGFGVVCSFDGDVYSSDVIMARTKILSAKYIELCCSP